MVDKLMDVDRLILVALVIIALFQTYQISTLESRLSNLKVTGVAAKVTTEESKPGGEENTLQQILQEITPKGTPDYGNKAGVSYDKVEEGLGVLRGYATLSLSSKEQERYNKIANTDGTACRYCCGATRLSQNCGCSHNIALQGLVKWLIKNTNYSDNEILKEIRKWQILFFPRPTLQEELQRRNIQPEAVGLPTMRGGC